MTEREPVTSGTAQDVRFRDIWGVAYGPSVVCAIGRGALMPVLALVSAVAVVAPLAVACLTLGVLGLAGAGWVGYWTGRVDRDRRTSLQVGASRR